MRFNRLLKYFIKRDADETDCQGKTQIKTDVKITQNPFLSVFLQSEISVYPCPKLSTKNDLDFCIKLEEPNFKKNPNS